MDYTNLMNQVRAHTRRCTELLQDERIVICIGDRLSLSLCIHCLDRDGQLVGAATGEREALQLIASRPASLLVATDELEEGSGDSLVSLVKQRWPTLRTLLIIRNPDRREAVRRAIEAGCDGLCLESRLGYGTVPQALSSVAGGGIYIDRSLASEFLHHHPAPPPPPAARLSERERDVLQLAAAGHPNPAIAAALFISLETVKSHMRAILRKLEARDRTHAVVQGLRLGLVDWLEAG